MYLRVVRRSLDSVIVYDTFICMIFDILFVLSYFIYFDRMELSPKIKFTYLLFFGVPFVGKSPQLFTKQRSKFIANLTIVKLIPTYKTFKVGNYFNLKSRTPTPLVSNVVYRFSCPCAADLTYIGKSVRHMDTGH